MRIALCALVAALAAACADSETITVTLEEWEAGLLRQSIDHQGRVDRVGLPLLASAARQCGGDVAQALGATFLNASSFFPMDRQAAEAVLGTDDRLQAVTVVRQLVGAAGLQKGDILLGVAGRAAPRGETAVDEWAMLGGHLMRSGQPFDVTVLRASQEIMVPLQPTLICGYRLDVWEGEDIFARTTGAEINVTRGLLRFARTDDELAVVLSHEIAHNTLDHANSPLSRIEKELEADYVGLYIMANAGMDIDGADGIWRRLRDLFPEDGSGTASVAQGTHPTHAARFAAFQDWIPEIKAKQAQGLPLVPEKHDWSRWLKTAASTPPNVGETAAGAVPSATP